MDDSFPLCFFKLKKIFCFLFFVFQTTYVVFIKKQHKKATSLGEEIINERNRAQPTLIHRYFLHPPLQNIPLMNNRLHYKMFPYCVCWELFVDFWELGHKCIQVPCVSLTVLGIVDLRPQRINFLFWEITNIRHLGYFLYQHLVYWHIQLFSCERQTVERVEKYVIQCFLCTTNSKYKWSSKKG